MVYNKYNRYEYIFKYIHIFLVANVSTVLFFFDLPHAYALQSIIIYS